MIGNQTLINNQILNHNKNKIKPIGKLTELDIVYMITDEYWKEWRHLLTVSEIPNITAFGLGGFNMMYGKGRGYLRRMIRKIRGYRSKYADTYLVEGTKGYNIHKNAIIKFRNTWKQVDKLKQELNYRKQYWRNKKIAKYGDKAIL